MVDTKTWNLDCIYFSVVKTEVHCSLRTAYKKSEISNEEKRNKQKTFKCLLNYDLFGISLRFSH